MLKKNLNVMSDINNREGNPGPRNARALLSRNVESREGSLTKPRNFSNMRLHTMNSDQEEENIMNLFKGDEVKGIQDEFNSLKNKVPNHRITVGKIPASISQDKKENGFHSEEESSARISKKNQHLKENIKMSQAMYPNKEATLVNNNVGSVNNNAGSVNNNAGSVNNNAASVNNNAGTSYGPVNNNAGSINTYAAQNVISTSNNMESSSAKPNTDMTSSHLGMESSGLISNTAVRGLFMNEHISKDERQRQIDMKKQMRDILDMQIQDKKRKQEEEKRKEREMEAKEQERIQKELQEIQKNFEKETNTAGNSKKRGAGYHNKESAEPAPVMMNNHPSKSPERKHVETKEEKVIIIENKLSSGPQAGAQHVPLVQKPKFEEPIVVSQEDLEKSIIEQDERGSNEALTYFFNRLNDSKPEQIDHELIKKILEDNIKLREEVNRNGEIISVLLDAWNSGKKTPNKLTSVLRKQMVGKNDKPEDNEKKAEKRRVLPPKASHKKLEDKLNAIDERIAKARNNRDWKKKERIQKLREEKAKHVEYENARKKSIELDDSRIFVPVNKAESSLDPTNRAARKVIKQAPPRTTDNSTTYRNQLNGVGLQETGSMINLNLERTLKSSTPYKSNMKYGKQPLLIEKNRNFEDINNFKLIENMLAVDDNEFINVEDDESAEHLNFHQFSRPPSKIEKLPLIKKSIELNSKSEFMYKHIDSEIANTMNLLEKMSMHPLNVNHVLQNGQNFNQYQSHNSLNNGHVHNGLMNSMNQPILKVGTSFNQYSPITNEKNWGSSSKPSFLSGSPYGEGSNPAWNNKEILIIENSGGGGKQENGTGPHHQKINKYDYGPAVGAKQGLEEKSEEKPSGGRFPRDVFSINAKRKFVV